MKKIIHLDSYNQKILAILHLQADLTNVELAGRVNLSPSACFQRVKALKEAGYFRTFHADVNIEAMCEHVFAYVEFTLHDNSAPFKRRFIAAIQEIPEFMDCMQITGKVDYVSFSCFANIAKLNEACTSLSDREDLGIKRIENRIILSREKFFLGYPLAQLKWLDKAKISMGESASDR
ncbi:Lrp/AsnC family transcriptional regulator [Alteromonas sp. KS69]|jgi:Lrp/AsnC family leucine-responsive transcriptional regulator|uniref:Lrp/AsnC family transcriptional regulator n=1 Tax=Alteromonas sp. KS69 TaxID=2109917 RepID=UPI000C4C509A|nr:Lrp/AsnC family transcriptional regulator [Alteromonas sp. KS69]MBB66842.1 AsnC family transcriptional regulator [Rickettsiales bacterium]RUP80014.1 Lrp/AsnC family transcriptional regulator [Alteromonas sp. KS69]|tara:strand:- start:3456 stop:3989 length:534 start_codon:yes stop_codon:yes gene_type:complete